MVAWAIAVVAGMGRIWEYKSTPGAAAAGPAIWPGSTLVSPQSGRATLMMFVHPHCPCSRASVAELGEIMARESSRVSAWVLFLRPQSTALDWEKTELWSSARKIPGVTVLTDKAGTEAARFGASTSGHVVLYDAHGRFVFGGGITGSRGHVGDNDGLKQVLALLDGDAGRSAHPVYGCGFHELNASLQ